MTHDTQGRFLGMPYDWRRPTARKVKHRLWNPGGPLLSPKVFGWGYTLNLAHPLSWVILLVPLVVVLVALIFG